MEFPVDPRKINKFEKQNDVSVNVSYLKKKGKIFDILPRHLTSYKNKNMLIYFYSKIIMWTRTRTRRRRRKRKRLVI